MQGQANAQKSDWVKESQQPVRRIEDTGLAVAHYRIAAVLVW